MHAPASFVRRHADALTFLALVPFAAHYAFSWIGFNPTDDGFVLAYGRRLLDGQVPHRDFIAIRPVGSALLHLPELLLARDAVFAASRFVWWCELALVAWIWVPLLARLLAIDLAPRERLLLRLLVVALSAHVAPPRAWHTVDGIALASMGIALAAGDRPAWKLVGYLLVGAAALCKQNFLALAPVVLVVLGDWRTWRYWLAAAAPGVLYVLVVVAAGGGADLVAQLGARHDLVTSGVAPYVSVRVAIGVALGGIAGWGRPRPGSVLASALAAGTVSFAGLCLLATAIGGGYALYARWPAFVLFGFALGRTAALVARREHAATRAACVVLAVAWASAISIGYPSPAYAAGILAALVLLLDRPAAPRRGAWLVAPVALACIGLVVARTQVVYRDLPAARLDRPLGDVFPGGAGIRTNTRTAAFLADLNRAVAFAETRGRRYAVLPEFPGHWATARQPNPLPIDWPHVIDLSTPALAARVVRSIEAERGRVLFLVQKVHAEMLALAAVPLADDGIYPPVTYLRATSTKIGETDYFDIYE